MPTLEFKGKQHIYAHHLTVPYRSLEPDPELSLNPAEIDDNVIIHGDNLHALKALLPRYAGKVKNKPVDGEDLERHDKWLCMMWPRLHLLKEFLSDEGVIFVSIDDNEQHRLRMMMDEVFGLESFVGTLTWISTTQPR